MHEIKEPNAGPVLRTGGARVGTSLTRQILHVSNNPQRGRMGTHTCVSPNAARLDRRRIAARFGQGGEGAPPRPVAIGPMARRARRRGGSHRPKRKRGRCCHRPRFGFRPGSCDPGRFPIGRPLKQAPTGFPISGPIEASSERSLCGSIARRLRFRRTPGKVGSDLGFPASSRFFPGCPTTVSSASIPKDLRRIRGGGTQKLSSVSGRPLLTAKCQYGQWIRFAEAQSACG